MKNIAGKSIVEGIVLPEESPPLSTNFRVDARINGHAC